MRLIIKYILFLMIPFILSGCFTTLYDKEELSEKANIKEKFDVDKNRFNHANKNLKTPIAQISYMLDDKNLHAIFEKAIEGNTDILILLSKINQAKASHTSAFASMFPSVNGNISSSRSEQNLNSLANTSIVKNTNTKGDISLSWEVDLFGKANALRGSAKESFLASQENLSNAQISLLGDVATYYYTALNIKNSIWLSTHKIQALQEIYNLTTLKYESGLSLLSDVNTALNNLSSEQNTLENLHYQYLQNLNSIRILLNDMSFDLASSGEYVLPRNINPSLIPNDILLTRKDIKAQVHNLNAQLYKETSAKASQLPTISLNGSISQILAGTVNVGNLTTQIVGNLSAPLINRFNLRANLLIEKENTKQSILTLQNLINTAISEIENAFKNNEFAIKQLENNQKSFDFAKENMLIYTERQKAGLIDELEYLSVKNSYFITQKNLDAAMLEYVKSYITLFKAFGGEVYQGNMAEENTKTTYQDIGE